MSSDDKLDRDFIAANAPTVIGKQVNINHEGCPAGEDTKSRLYIKRTHNAVLAYCHHCGCSRVLKNNTRRSLAEIKKELAREYDHPSADCVLLPEDLEYDTTRWPVRWIAAAEIEWRLNKSAMLEHRVGYSPSLDRLIFPYYNTDNVLVFWQGRKHTIYSRQDALKWLNVRSSHKPLGFFPSMNERESNHTVIVEDVISALRVVQDTRQSALCLYGTNITDEQVNAVLSLNKEVVVWLDADTAGQAADTEIVNRFKSLMPRGLSGVSGVYSSKNLLNKSDAEKEPKHLSPSDLKDYLG